ncbi:exodeoxyribonuclease V subunit beta [Niveibacterium sp. SC-1]|uniref:exodeoxyribonuclease V subunit beta n=1 Tax=Niveibacterium sp. SC-1 TaxID=3135646 RepID=UPI00311EAE86
MTLQPLDALSLPLHGSRLIEASAGTGKTWTIASLYLRLVLGHGEEDSRFARPLMPREILVMTFTRAATKELVDRIRTRLGAAARVFRGEVPAADPVVAGLLASYAPATHARQAWQLEQAAAAMDEAAVSTIDAWCQRMLREHAFDSGSLFELTLTTDEAELAEAALADLLRHLVQFPARDFAALCKLCGSPASLERELHGLLRQGITPATSQPPDAAPLAVFEELLAARRATRGGLPQTVQAAVTVVAALVEQGTLRDHHMHGRLDRLLGWVEDADADAPDLSEKGWASLEIAAVEKKIKASLPPEAAAALDALADARARIAAPSPVAADFLAWCLAWLRARIAEAKTRRGLAGFQDMQQQLADALADPERGPRLAAAIRRQFPVALIDEFQDTSVLQYALFDQVYGIGRDAPEHALLLIGDPKQAIYGFRGADVFTYLKASAACGPQRSYTLQTNWRSTGAMVAAINRLFENAQARHVHGAFALDRHFGLAFHPVEAHGRAEVFEQDGLAQPALDICLLPGEEAGLSRETMLARLAPLAAGHIASLIAKGAVGSAGFRSPQGFAPLRPADIAVLIPGAREARAIRAALADAGVRSVYLSDRESVFASQEALDLLCWLEAAAEPRSAQRLRTALATPTLDWSWAELAALGDADGAAWEREAEAFARAHALWLRHGVLAMLTAFMAWQRLPQRLLASEGGARTLTNLRHLGELLQQAAQQHDGPAALIHWLREAIRDADASAPADDAKIRLESDDGLVRVVTLHSSKGLEYPIVFMPFATSYGPPKGKPHFSVYHDAQGDPHCGRDEAAQTAAARESLQERLRLAYVGLTRARHALWLGLAAVTSGKHPMTHLTGLGYLLGTGDGEAMDAAGFRHAVKTYATASGARLNDTGAAAPQTSIPAASESAESPKAAVLATRTMPPLRFPAWRWTSFSGLASGLDAARRSPGISTAAIAVASEPALQEISPRSETAAEPREEAAVSEALDIHGFPRGAEAGTQLHDLLEWSAREGFAVVSATPERAQERVAQQLQSLAWARWRDTAQRWLLRVLDTPLSLPAQAAPVRLRELARYQAEMEFVFGLQDTDFGAADRLLCQHTLGAIARPALVATRHGGMLNGFMDLVFEHEGRYYVLDYKSNRLGADAAAYSAEALTEAMAAHRYDLQYMLYVVALHRHLKARLGTRYDYARHMGGAVYVFLRGMDGPVRGCFLDRPALTLVEALDALFRGRPAVPEQLEMWQ